MRSHHGSIHLITWKGHVILPDIESTYRGHFCSYSFQYPPLAAIAGPQIEEGHIRHLHLVGKMHLCGVIGGPVYLDIVPPRIGTGQGREELSQLIVHHQPAGKRLAMQSDGQG